MSEVFFDAEGRRTIVRARERAGRLNVRPACLRSQFRFIRRRWFRTSCPRTRVGSPIADYRFRSITIGSAQATLFPNVVPASAVGDAADDGALSIPSKGSVPCSDSSLSCRRASRS